MIEYARFLGHYTSSIQFDREQQVWRWLDMKEGKSVATRTWTAVGAAGQNAEILPHWPRNNLSWTATTFNNFNLVFGPTSLKSLKLWKPLDLS